MLMTLMRRRALLAAAAGMMLANFSGSWTPACASEMREIRNVALPPSIAGAVVTAGQLPSLLPGALGLDSESSFTIRSAQPLPNNAGQTIRLDQTYRGVPIWSHQIVVQLSPAGRIQYMTGTAVFDIKGEAPAPTPALSASDAMQRGKGIASANVPAPRSLTYRNEENNLVYYLSANGVLQLAYRISFYAELRDAAGSVTPSRPVYFIDANTGTTIYSYENLQHAALGTGPGGNLKTGQWTWGSSAAFPKFQVLQNGANCTMDDGATVFAQDWQHSESQTGTATPFLFTCFNNTYQNINGGYSPLNDAISFGYALYNMYQSWYGIPPISQKLWLRVHFGTSYENAFWDGTAMSFGDGATTFYPLVGMDVMGHEVSHGFTEQNSGLIYQFQSGGMNEAFSDMAGEALEYYYFQTYGALFPRTMPDYNVGAEIFKAPNQALRYMCNPPLDGISIDKTTNYNNNLDVHYTSGVYNKAFCALGQTSGWNARKAFDVFLLANKNYWTPNTTYRTGADGVIQAATVLGYSLNDVKAAFKQVGIGPLPSQTGNDNFASGLPIQSGWTTIVGTNVGATKETGEPNLTPSPGGKSVWWTCLANSTGSATISTKGSNFDTILGIFTGTAVNALTKLAEDDDSGGNTTSQVTFSAVSGTTYRIMVDGYSAASGEIVVNLTNLTCAGGGATATAATHDFNGDGKSDIAWRNGLTGEGAIWLMNGTAISQTGSLGVVSSSWSIVGQRDFNGDGKYDLLWRSSTGQVAIWFMNGTAVSSSVSLGNVPTAWVIAGTSDFNDDGKGDILWRNTSTGEVAIWLMNGSSILQSGSLGIVPLTWQISGTDGKGHIAWRDGSGQVALWVMNGLQVAQTKGFGMVPNNWVIVGAGDFSGVGKTCSDFLWRDTSTGAVAIWFINNGVVTGSAGLGNIPGAWQTTVTGDFNADSKSDILWRETSGGQVAIWLMNGSTVSQSASLGIVPTTWGIQAFNAD